MCGLCGVFLTETHWADSMVGDADEGAEGVEEIGEEDGDDGRVARAVRHSADLPALARLRQDLRQRLLDSPLCDAVRFAGYFEQALRVLWRDWCGRQRIGPP